MLLPGTADRPRRWRSALRCPPQKPRGACLLSIDTEGTDGTTVCAGGITDSDSSGGYGEAGVDIYGALRGHVQLLRRSPLLAAWS